MNNSAYNLLVEMADTLKSEGYLEIFRTDLTKHDKEALQNVPEGTPFLWCIRAHGTWIHTKVGHLDSKKSLAWKQSAYACIKDFFAPQEEKHKLFYFDGKKLTEVRNADKGCEILLGWEGKSRVESDE